MNVYAKRRAIQQHHGRMDTNSLQFQGKNSPSNYFPAVDAVQREKARWTMNPRLLFHKTSVYSSSYGLLTKEIALSLK